MADFLVKNISGADLDVVLTSNGSTMSIPEDGSDFLPISEYNALSAADRANLEIQSKNWRGDTRVVGSPIVVASGADGSEDLLTIDVSDADVTAIQIRGIGAAAGDVKVYGSIYPVQFGEDFGKALLATVTLAPDVTNLVHVGADVVVATLLFDTTGITAGQADIAYATMSSKERG